MKSKGSVRQQSHSVLRILNVALITVIVMFVLSGISFAQGRLPFIGTRTFCAEDDEGKATITIRKDGFTTVKSDMSLDEAYPFAFSGMLNAKGILRRERERYLEIISATAIRMHDGGTWIDGKLCGEVLPKESTVLSVAFSPDGKTLASGNLGSTINLWDVGSGQRMRTLKGHSSVVNSVAFGADGKTLASGSEDNTVKLWDVVSGQELKTFKGHSGGVRSVAFTPDGETLATGNFGRTIELWDVATGKELKTLRGHSDIVLSVAFSPDGKTVASGSGDKTIKLWDVASGQELKTLKGHPTVVYSIAFSPDGGMLASGGEGTIILWDVARGQQLKTLRSTVESVAFSPDGRTLASGGFAMTSGLYDTIKLWDVASGQVVKTLKGHSTNVHSVVFSRDGKTLASGGSGGFDNTIKLWDVASGQEVIILKLLPKESNDDQSLSSPPNYDIWAGTYEYGANLGRTSGGTVVFIEYTIEISSGNGKLGAVISASGYQTDDEVRCDTKTEGKRINLYFNSYPDGGTANQYGVELYKKGELLLTLETVSVRGKTGYKVYWGAYSTSLSKQVTFKKTK